MFYFLSKILDMAFSPLVWTMGLLGVSLAWRGSPVWKPRFVVGALLVLVFFALEPVSNALYRSLEQPPVRTYRPDVVYDVAILLGGVVEDRIEEASGERAYNDNNERLLETFDLLRTGAARNAIISGGPASASRARVVEARVLADQLVAWGIAPDRIVAEERSRNTHENAVESAAIVRKNDWQSVLLVTSAFHMRRASGCFRAEGLATDTLPVDYRSFASPSSAELLPRASHLEDSSAALREWFGRGIYRLRGYTR